jgi:hypothetical protein
MMLWAIANGLDKIKKWKHTCHFNSFLEGGWDQQYVVLFTPKIFGVSGCPMHSAQCSKGKWMAHQLWLAIIWADFLGLELGTCAHSGSSGSIPCPGMGGHMMEWCLVHLQEHTPQSVYGPMFNSMQSFWFPNLTNVFHDFLDNW